MSHARVRPKSSGKPRVALVTGTGRGIGRATAEAFAERAADRGRRATVDVER